jgi:hypothetical protein
VIDRAVPITEKRNGGRLGRRVAEPKALIVIAHEVIHDVDPHREDHKPPKEEGRQL